VLLRGFLDRHSLDIRGDTSWNREVIPETRGESSLDTLQWVSGAVNLAVPLDASALILCRLWLGDLKGCVEVILVIDEPVQSGVTHGVHYVADLSRSGADQVSQTYPVYYEREGVGDVGIYDPYLEIVGVGQFNIRNRVLSHVVFLNSV
jgi:hypothetical protein